MSVECAWWEGVDCRNFRKLKLGKTYGIGYFTVGESVIAGLDAVDAAEVGGDNCRAACEVLATVIRMGDDKTDQYQYQDPECYRVGQ